jgi:hypothetical protein
MPASAGLVYDNGSEVWFNVKGLSLDNGKVTEAVREALEGKQTTIEIQVWDNNGEEKWVSGRCSPCPKGCNRVITRCWISEKRGFVCRNCNETRAARKLRGRPKNPWIKKQEGRTEGEGAKNDVATR